MSKIIHGKRKNMSKITANVKEELKVKNHEVQNKGMKTKRKKSSKNKNKHKAKQKKTPCTNKKINGKMRK